MCHKLLKLALILVLLCSLISGFSGSLIAQDNDGLDYFRKQVKATPGDANAYFNLGRAYLFIKNYDQTIQSIEKAIELDPDLVPAYMILALVYFDKNDIDQGKEIYLKGIDRISIINEKVKKFTNEEVEKMKLEQKKQLEAELKKLENQPINPNENYSDGLKAAFENAIKANCSKAASNVLTYLAVEDLTPSEAAKKALEELQKENRKSVFDNKIPAYGTEALPGLVTILPTDNNTVEITGYGLTNKVLVKKEVEAP